MAKAKAKATKSPRNVRSNRNFTDAEFTVAVNRMRSWLTNLARKRSSRTVTADDAHTYLDRQGIRPQQVRTRLRFINSVLRETNFEYSGRTRSSRPAARGRMISEWTI